MNKTANPDTGTTPPTVVRGALYQGATSDTRVYMYGGTMTSLNTSSPYYVGPTAVQYTLWSYDTSSGNWDQFDVTSAGDHRPNWGAWTEAPDQGLAFYFNGMIDNGSSLDTDVLKQNVQYLESMQVLDLQTRTAKNVSTSAVSNGNGRIGASLEYVPHIGEKGILALIGGGEQSYQNSTGAPPGVLNNGTLVGCVEFGRLPAVIEHAGSHGHGQRL